MGKESELCVAEKTSRVPVGAVSDLRETTDRLTEALERIEVRLRDVEDERTDRSR